MCDLGNLIEVMACTGGCLGGNSTVNAYKPALKQVTAYVNESKPFTEIHKYSSYKCQICGKWHIGKNKNRVLTEQDREKIKKQIQVENFYKKASYGK